MLGHTIADPDGIEGPPGTDTGLGLLDVHTVMTPEKQVSPAEAVHVPSNQPFDGYEIHVGRTTGPDCESAFAKLNDRSDGAISRDGQISGTYLHGMFRDNAFRRQWLAGFGVTQSVSYDREVEDTLDRLADHLERHVAVDALLNEAV
jgi:adenosylcobyric acid synthase